MPLPSDASALARRAALAHMEAIGLGQGQLATRAGLDRATLNRVENAQQSVSVDRAFVLAEALGVRLSDLIGAAEDHAGWRVHI